MIKSFKSFLKEDVSSLFKKIGSDMDEYREKFISVKMQEYGLFLNDFILEEHFDDYMVWVKRNFSPSEIEEEKYVEESAFRKFMFENEDLINNWLLKDAQFIEWAEDRLYDQDHEPEGDIEAFKRKRDME